MAKLGTRNFYHVGAAAGGGPEASSGSPLGERLGLPCQLLSERQGADAFAARRKDRVHKRRRDRRHPGLAHAAHVHIVAARHDIDMRLTGRVADPEHLVVVKVALLHPAVFERNLVQEANPEPHDDRSLELRADSIRIHDGTAINGDVDTRHCDVALLVDRSLDHRRHIAHKAAVDSETKAMTFRHLALAPTRLLRDQIDNVAQPAGVDRIDLRILAVVPEFFTFCGTSRMRAGPIRSSRNAF